MTFGLFIISFEVLFDFVLQSYTWLNNCFCVNMHYWRIQNFKHWYCSHMVSLRPYYSLLF